MRIKFNLSIINSGLLLVFVLLSSGSNGQYFKLTTSFGGSIYQGDLSNGVVSSIGPAASVGLTYDLYDNFRLRTNLSFLQVSADDSKSPKLAIKERNLNFKSDIIELSLMGEVDLLNSEDYTLVPYLFGGPSIYHFNPYTTIKQSDITEEVNLGYTGLFKVGQKVYLHDIGTEGQILNDNTLKTAGKSYNLTQLNIQLGGGFRYKISDAISIGYEFSFRKLFTDYLDDVSSKNYISAGEWTKVINLAKASGNTARVKLLEEGETLSWRELDSKGNSILLKPGPPRGNPDANDAYFSSQVRLSFTLFSKSDNYARGNNKLYSPGNPRGKGQLNCPKVFY